jgi:hypothetical protein
MPSDLPTSRRFSAFLQVALAASVLALSACASGASRTEPFAVAPKPALPSTGSALRTPVYGSNADHTDNLIDLYFRTEWDDTRKGLAKWDGPVTVSLDSAALQDYRPFLTEYLQRLRNEAGIDIQVADSGAGAISVITAPADQMRRSFSTAYCLVTPGRIDFGDLINLLARPDEIDWTLIETIKAATVFSPSDASPYQVRACLMEEVAQALGPGNDIFYLADTIFNDDGAHVRPTSFDMLALRVLYDPALRPGMTLDEAKPIVRDLLNKFHPEGAGVPRGPTFHPAPEWKDTILASSAYGVPPTAQLAIAEEAVRLSRNFSQTDPRRGFSFERLGRAYLAQQQPEKAEFAFRRAMAAYELSVGDQDVRVASARVGLAIALNEQGKNGQVLTQIDLAMPVLAAYDTEDRITRALKERHDAQTALGQKREALQTALMGVDWALYTLGADYGELAQNRKDILDVYEEALN